MPDHSRRSKKAHMTLEWPKNVIEEMTEVLLSLLYMLVVREDTILFEETLLRKKAKTMK